MRYSMIYILTAITSIFFACTKESVEPNQKPNAVTSYVLSYDDKWNLIEKKFSFHWHNMDAEILAQFPRGNDTLCTIAGNDVITYNLQFDECEKLKP